VIDNAGIPTSGTVFLPQFADGGGWKTQVILVNPTDTPMTGTVEFANGTGAAANVTVGAQTSSSFMYSVPRRGSQKFVTSGLAQVTSSGSVRIVPAGGGFVPVSQVVFSFRSGAITISEAGVTPSIGTVFRMFAESSWRPGTPGNIQTGIALTNTASSLATVTFELMRLDGSSTGTAPASISVPAFGQTAKFLGEIFTSLPDAFSGMLRISSTTNISVVGLRGRYNERSEFLITTTPPADEAAAPINDVLFFPHFADSGGYTTEFILFSGAGGQASSGKLQLFPQ